MNNIELMQQLHDELVYSLKGGIIPLETGQMIKRRREKLIEELRAQLAQQENQRARDSLPLMVEALEKLEQRQEALAQPESEPVAKPVGCVQEVHTNHSWGGSVGVEAKLYGRLPVGTLLYTAPPQQHSEQWWKHEVSNAFANGYEKGRAKREWVGLTDDERNSIINFIWMPLNKLESDVSATIARAIEAKLKEKNT